MNNRAVQNQWKTPDEFYFERDNRTALGVQDLGQYTTRRIEIHIDPNEMFLPSVQEMALLACNLTARWARRIAIFGACAIPLAKHLQRNKYELIGQRISDEMRLADPFGEFNLMSVGGYGEELDSEPPLRLFIGGWHTPGSIPILADDFVINAIDWCAVGKRGRKLEQMQASARQAAVPAVGLAASLGVADLFKRAVRHDKKSWLPDFCWDLYRQELSSLLCIPSRNGCNYNSIDIGKVLLAGVGAIGSALIYLLDFHEIKGSLTLLDRDRVETSNLNRSPLFNINHVWPAELKTDLSIGFLEHQTGLKVKKIDGTWHEHGPQLTRELFDVWISFTNEDGAWAEIPFQLPPVVLQGTTTSGWGFGAGRHIPRREDCTLCRLPRPTVDFRGPCAEGEIQPTSQGAPARASLPFLSVASASLVLAEFMKLNSPNASDLRNEISADLRSGLPAVNSIKRLIDYSCRGCAAGMSKLWLDRGGRGRFRELSISERQISVSSVK